MQVCILFSPNVLLWNNLYTFMSTSAFIWFTLVVYVKLNIVYSCQSCYERVTQPLNILPRLRKTTNYTINLLYILIYMICLNRTICSLSHPKCKIQISHRLCARKAFLIWLKASTMYSVLSPELFNK